jgi:hypothetical protein
MNIDAEKFAAALPRVGGAVRGAYTEAAVTLGEVDGVVYRLVAMDALTAEDKDCTEGPEWAACVRA